MPRAPSKTLVVLGLGSRPIFQTPEPLHCTRPFLLGREPCPCVPQVGARLCDQQAQQNEVPCRSWRPQLTAFRSVPSPCAVLGPDALSEGQGRANPLRLRCLTNKMRMFPSRWISSGDGQASHVLRCCRQRTNMMCHQGLGHGS